MSTQTQFSPFVEIKAGEEEPPILIAHGLSGRVQVRKLAKHICTNKPIYGIQAKGIDGGQEPLRRVEDMAAFYLDELEHAIPGDAYILVGYSFGGLVALEMAQRLLTQQKHIPLLVLLDTFPHPRFMPWPWRLRLFAKRMRIHARQIRQMPVAKAVSYLLSGVRRRLHLARPLNDTEGTPEMLNLSAQEAAFRLVNERAYRAYEDYRPRFYPGKIRFVTTEAKTFFPGDPAAIWGDLTGELVVEVTPGDHLNIVTTEFEDLASILTRYIAEEQSASARNEGHHSPVVKYS